jgi:hypothetical protein
LQAVSPAPAQTVQFAKLVVALVVELVEVVLLERELSKLVDFHQYLKLKLKLKLKLN